MQNRYLGLGARRQKSSSIYIVFNFSFLEWTVSKIFFCVWSCLDRKRLLMLLKLFNLIIWRLMPQNLHALWACKCTVIYMPASNFTRSRASGSQDLVKTGKTSKSIISFWIKNWQDNNEIKNCDRNNNAIYLLNKYVNLKNLQLTVGYINQNIILSSKYMSINSGSFALVRFVIFVIY